MYSKTEHIHKKNIFSFKAKIKSSSRGTLLCRLSSAFFHALYVFLNPGIHKKQNIAFHRVIVKEISYFLSRNLRVGVLDRIQDAGVGQEDDLFCMRAEDTKNGGDLF